MIMTIIARVKTIGSTTCGSGTEYEVGDELTVNNVDVNSSTGLPQGFRAIGKDGKPMYAALIQSAHLDEGDWELIGWVPTNSHDITNTQDAYDRAMGVI